MLQPMLVTPSRALLTGLIDYAGLFPPASLDMSSSVAEFREARTGPDGWIVHRFLCGASRLQELAAVIAATMTKGETPWSVGCIVDGPLGASIGAAQDFEAEMAPGASITAVEARLAAVMAGLGVAEGAAVEAIVDAVNTLGEATMAYVEVPLDGPEAGIAAVAAAAAAGRPVGAKLRCGGVVPEAIPSVSGLARALVAVAGAGVTLKATAGLHHPVRRHDPGLDTEMHGFLNLAVAFHLARTGAPVGEIEDALAETDPAAFRFGAANLAWRGHVLGSRVIQGDRAEGLHGFGSCSFAEPIEDLVAMGLAGVSG